MMEKAVGQPKTRPRADDMRKLLFALLILWPFLLAGQDMPFAVKAKTRYSASGAVGYEQVDDITYYQLRLIQEFNYKKVFMGIDLDFLFDKKGNLRKSDWDHLQNAVEKIYFVKYGNKSDPFYVHVGGFPEVNMGNGLIMNRYSNMQLYPELRNIGLMIGGNLDIPTHPSFELFSSNIIRNHILSFSARCKPLPDSTVAVLDGMILGASVITDRNQYANVKYVADDAYQPGNVHLKPDPVTVLGAAYTVPLYQSDTVTLGNYSEFAHILGKGSGAILPGIYADFDWLKVNLEYRLYGSRFTPSFFDRDYEEERAYQVEPGVADYATKESLLDSLTTAQGFNGSIQGTFKGRVKASFAWQNLIGRDYKTSKSIWLRLWVDTKYKRLENFSIAYNKVNTNKMGINHVIEPNAEFKFSVTLKISRKKWYLVARYAEKYQDKNDSGEINWLKETKHTATVGLKFVY
jgi:hypothetical protein